MKWKKDPLLRAQWLRFLVAINPVDLNIGIELLPIIYCMAVCAKDKELFVQ